MCTNKDQKSSEAAQPQARPVSDIQETRTPIMVSSTAWLTRIYERIGVS